MKRNFFKRLRAGFTLAESLVAIAVLSLLTTAVIAVTTTIFSTKNTMIELGKCQTLASTAVMTLADEVRYGQNLRVDAEEETIVFDSRNFGADILFYLKDGKVHAKSKGAEEPYPLLPDKYYGSLRITHLKLEKVEVTPASGAEGTEGTESAEGEEPAAVSLYAVKISVTVNGSGKNLYSTELTVPALNGIK